MGALLVGCAHVSRPMRLISDSRGAQVGAVCAKCSHFTQNAPKPRALCAKRRVLGCTACECLDAAQDPYPKPLVTGAQGTCTTRNTRNAPIAPCFCPERSHSGRTMCEHAPFHTNRTHLALGIAQRGLTWVRSVRKSTWSAKRGARTRAGCPFRWPAPGVAGQSMAALGPGHTNRAHFATGIGPPDPTWVRNSRNMRKARNPRNPTRTESIWPPRAGYVNLVRGGVSERPKVIASKAIVG